MDALRRADVERMGTGGLPPRPGPAGGGPGWRRLVLLAVLGFAATLVARRFVGVDPQAPLEGEPRAGAPLVAAAGKIAMTSPGVVGDAMPPTEAAPDRRVPVPASSAALGRESTAAPRVAAGSPAGGRQEVESPVANPAPGGANRVGRPPLAGEPTGAVPPRVALPSGTRPANAGAAQAGIFGAGDPAGIREAALARAAERRMQRGTFSDPNFAGAERGRRPGEAREEHQARIATLRAERRSEVRAMTPEQRAERMRALAQARQRHGAERLEEDAARAEHRLRSINENSGAPAVAPPPGPRVAGAGSARKMMAAPLPGAPQGLSLPPAVPSGAGAEEAPGGPAHQAPTNVAAVSPRGGIISDSSTQLPASPKVAAAPPPAGAAGHDATAPAASTPAPIVVPPPALGLHQPAADRLASVLRRPPAGAGDIKILFLQWSLRPELRFAHVSLDGGRATEMHEGETLGDLRVVRIYDDIVEFSRAGNDFLLRVN